MAGKPLSGFPPRPDLALRILIVEDEVFIALNLEMQLMELGHEVVGIAACKATAIELALIDLHLAGLPSGAEAAALMRTNLGIPSIIVSGSPHERRRTS